MTYDRLPHFEHPPVVETVLGVQFDPLPKFRNAHLGAFWKQLGNDWPDLRDVPPLAPQYERFGEGESWVESGLQLKLTQEPTSRMQARNAAGNRMVQVQNGRFHYNWLGHGGEQYPRYREVRPEFDRTLDLFRRFLADEQLGVLQPNQWEVTYVNHIPKGSVWNSPADWARVFRLPVALSDCTRGLILESVGGTWHYVIEPCKGRLHVQLQHGRSGEATGPEVVTLILTARGSANPEEGGSNLDEGLDLGHETIVKSFAALTSESAHAYWRIVDERD
jgi:uncharacterized protein (TIGR04255 family)